MPAVHQSRRVFSLLQIPLRLLGRPRLRATNLARLRQRICARVTPFGHPRFFETNFGLFAFVLECPPRRLLRPFSRAALALAADVAFPPNLPSAAAAFCILLISRNKYHGASAYAIAITLIKTTSAMSFRFQYGMTS